MSDEARFLRRAVDAEEQLELAQERIESLELRLRSILQNDPTTATRALAWMGRAQNSEKLLAELVTWVRENPSVADLLPRGFLVRAEAQLHSVEILKRDQEAFGERPPDEEWWQSWRDVGEAVRVTLDP